MTAQTLVFGVVTGAYLVVATLGFALVSRVEKFLNIAHAELISAGAFITYFLNATQGWSIIPASVVAILVVALLAALLGRFVYSPIRRASPVVLLITSVGVVYVLHGMIEAIVTPGVYSLDLPREGTLELGGVEIGTYDLLIIGLAASCIVALHAAMTKTQIGLQLRALASDDQLAAARGIDAARVSTYVWLAAGAMVGLAGVLLGFQGALNTNIAFAQILLILSVSIVAGIGSLYGVVVAGLLLGIAMDMSTLVIPAGYREAIAFVVIIVILLIRPQGLSGQMMQRRQA